MPHTPGPWIVEQKNKNRKKNENEFVVCGRHQSYFGIAVVGGPSNNDMREELLSNVKLIACAPVMRECLEAVAKLNEGQGRLNLCEIAGWAKQILSKLS